MSYYKGLNNILLIKRDGAYLPVGCLTENSFEESSEFIGTMTRENAGWKTSKPLSQSYSITFTGLQPIWEDGAVYETDFISYSGLKKIKRNSELIEWETITAGGDFVEKGKAYISSISEAAPADGWLTYSCSLTGFGVPETVEIVKTNIFTNVFNSIFR